MLDAFVERALRDAQGKGGDPRARHIERRHGDLHAFAFLAEEIGGRDVNIFQQQLHCVGTANSQFVVHSSDREARPPLLNDESAHTLHSLARIRFGEDHIDTGVTAVGDKAFTAIEDIFVTRLDSRGPSRRDIRAGVRLRSNQKR